MIGVLAAVMFPDALTRAAVAETCPALTATSVTQEDYFFNPALRGYGNSNAYTTDWTGGDATYSARLPDGRTVWIFADTFLGTVDGAGSRPASEPLTHGSMVLQSAAAAGSLFSTTISGTDFLPAAAANTFWQPAAVTTDSEWGSTVLRVLVYQMGTDDAAWPYGYPMQTAIATYSISATGLTRTGFSTLPALSGDKASRVTYGSFVVSQDGYFYVYGHDWRSSNAQAFVARVPAGQLANYYSWRYWNGGAWTDSASWASSAASSVPLSTGGVRFGYSVLKSGSTYVLLTMDPQNPTGLNRLDTYWGCTPVGPWYGPTPAYDAATDGKPLTGNTVYYNPHFHPEWGDDGTGWLVSYDVNDTWANIHGNVELYRPRFAKLKLG